MISLSQALRTTIFTVMFLSLAVGMFPVMAKIEPLESGECGKLGLTCSGTSDSSKTVKERISAIVNVALSLVGILAVIFVIYGGVKYIISMGDEKETTTAKRIILYAVIGLLVIGLAAVMVNFVINSFGGGAKP